MPPSVCFVTYELHPANPGGCGVLIEAALPHLLSAGVEIHILADMPRPEAEVFKAHAARTLSGPIDVHHIDDLLPTDRPELRLNYFGNRYLHKSHRFAEALRTLSSRVRLDLVEFHEYCGPAYYYLQSRRLGLAEIGAAVVRIHGSMELIDEAEAIALPTWEQQAMYRMERFCLKNADLVLAPSAGIADYYVERFAIDRERLRLSPPFPQRALAADEINKPDRVVFLGKLQEIKGVDLFVDAALTLIRRGVCPAGGFVIIGPDLPHATAGMSYQTWLSDRIPAALRHHFRFTGRLDWDGIRQELSRALAAVFPSRFESFCLAAHEAAASGIPLVLSNIPAFASSFTDSVDALLVELDSDDIADKTALLIQDAERRRQLARRRVYRPEALVAPYLAAVPPRARLARATSRHTKSVALLLESAGKHRDDPGSLGDPQRIIHVNPTDPQPAHAETVGPGAVAVLRPGDTVDPRVWTTALRALKEYGPGCLYALSPDTSQPFSPVELIPVRSLLEVPFGLAFRWWWLLDRPMTLRDLLKPQNSLTAPLAWLRHPGPGALWHVIPEPWVRAVPVEPTDGDRSRSMAIVAQVVRGGTRWLGAEDWLIAGETLVGMPADSAVEALARELDEVKKELGLLKGSRGWKAVMLWHQLRDSVLDSPHGGRQLDPLIRRARKLVDAGATWINDRATHKPRGPK